MALRVVPVEARWYCLPWHLRRQQEREHGSRCVYCDREIVVPDRLRGVNCGCLYCGMDNGSLPLTEAEEYGPDVPAAWINR